MNHAITTLQIALQTAENNAPINRAAGNHDQANLEDAVAADCREAIQILSRHAQPWNGAPNDVGGPFPAPPQSPPPAPGRLVLYRLTALDAERINDRRTRTNGNIAAAGDEFPMIVTRVWSEECVNGQVLLDGDDPLWVSSTTRQNPPGTPQPDGRWRWPDRS